MKHKDYLQLAKFKVDNMIFIPANSNAEKLALMNDRQNILMMPQTPRDVNLHRCYHLFCGWLWDKMPTEFKVSRCRDKHQMYNYLKIISGQYDLAMTYRDKKFYRFESISFGNMSNEAFKLFLEEQMNSIYTELLIPLRMEALYEQMETEFKKIFKELL